jgi:hypothetical protein
MVRFLSLRRLAITARAFAAELRKGKDVAASSQNMLDVGFPATYHQALPTATRPKDGLSIA